MKLYLPDELEKEFRICIAVSKGMKKGNLSEAFQEAMTLWIEKINPEKMSVNVRYDEMKGRWIIKSEGWIMELPKIETAVFEEVSIALLHFFRPKQLVKIHEQYSLRGMCPVCRSLWEKNKADRRFEE